MKQPILMFGAGLAMTIASAVTIAASPKVLAAQAAAAHVQVATFAIANMTCATCPITVRKAMSAVQGVRSVKVDFQSKTATAEFDPKVTNAAAIAAASTNAGYPAKPKG